LNRIDFFDIGNKTFVTNFVRTNLWPTGRYRNEIEKVILEHHYYKLIDL